MVFRSGTANEAGSPVGRAGSRAVRARPARCCSLQAEDERVARLLGEEAAARRSGKRWIAGVDEVGRGALAGPVVAAAVVLDPARTAPRGLDDSKALPPEVREDVARRVRREALACGIGEATAAEIDALGIVRATAIAMRRALERVGPVDLALVDGFDVHGLGVPQRPIVRGDAQVASIAAASVVAKVHRDALLDQLGAGLPHFGFVSNRGYGTPQHLEALRRHGPSAAHRLTFDGVLPFAGAARRESSRWSRGADRDDGEAGAPSERDVRASDRRDAA